MRFKFPFLLPAFVLCASLLAAEPVLHLHDGTGWREIQPQDWQELPRQELQGKARNGETRTYSGVAIAELLKLLQAPAGGDLRGGAMNRALLLSASDGYRVVFSLAELDASFRKNPVLLADRVDGAPLDAHEGPFMLVVPENARHSRWIRQVNRIMLVSVDEPAP